MMVESATYRENGKYCEYHQDSGHTTTECRSLARAIKQTKIPTMESRPAPALKPVVIPIGHKTPKPESDKPEVEDIFSISGRGTSWTQDPVETHRYTTNTTRAILGKKRKPTEGISFTNTDLVDITTPHHDPLVITPMLKRKNGGQVRLHRVLVDIILLTLGSTAEKLMSLD